MNIFTVLIAYSGWKVNEESSPIFHQIQHCSLLTEERFSRALFKYSSWAVRENVPPTRVTSPYPTEAALYCLHSLTTTTTISRKGAPRRNQEDNSRWSRQGQPPAASWRKEKGDQDRATPYCSLLTEERSSRALLPRIQGLPTASFIAQLSSCAGAARAMPLLPTTEGGKILFWSGVERYRI